MFHKPEQVQTFFSLLARTALYHVSINLYTHVSMQEEQEERCWATWSVMRVWFSGLVQLCSHCLCIKGIHGMTAGEFLIVARWKVSVFLSSACPGCWYSSLPKTGAGRSILQSNASMQKCSDHFTALTLAFLYCCIADLQERNFKHKWERPAFLRLLKYASFLYYKTLTPLSKLTD